MQDCNILAGSSTLGRGKHVFVSDKYQNLLLVKVANWRNTSKGRVLHCRLLYTTYNGLLATKTTPELKTITFYLEKALEKGVDAVLRVLEVIEIMIRLETNTPETPDDPAPN